MVDLAACFRHAYSLMPRMTCGISGGGAVTCCAVPVLVVLGWWWPALVAFVAAAGFVSALVGLLAFSWALRELDAAKAEVIAQTERGNEVALDLAVAFDQLAQQRERTEHLQAALGWADPDGPDR